MIKALYSKTNIWTLSGLGAVLIWSFTGVVGGNVTHIPIYQFLFWSGIAAFLCLAGSISIQKKWKRVLKQPMWFWAVMSISLCTNQLSYIMAFRYAPPEQVDLINYQWPMLLALAVSFLPGQRFHWTYLLGSLIGMAGVWWMFMGGGGHSLELTGRGLIGSLWAALGAISWIVYCIASRLNSKAAPESIALPILFSIVISALLQKGSATAGIPMQLSDYGWCLAWGGGCFALAFTLWDMGVRRGDIRTLSLISYLTPIGSIALLVVFDLAPGTIHLAIASGMIVIGSIVSKYGPGLRRTSLQESDTAEEERMVA